MSAPKSDLLRGIALMIEIFHKYSGTDKDNKTLSKKELATLLRVELHLDEMTCKNAEMDEIMKSLDCNADEKVDFKEFMTMVAVFAVLRDELGPC